MGLSPTFAFHGVGLSPTSSPFRGGATPHLFPPSHPGALVVYPDCGVLGIPRVWWSSLRSAFVLVH